MAYANRDDRIRYYRSEKNTVAGWSACRVYELGTGKSFKWACADDVLEPDLLRRCVEILESDGWAMQEPSRSMKAGGSALRAKDLSLSVVGDQLAPAGHLPKHLKSLEAESIDIMREVAADFRNPVMLYSIGKDSSVMLHLVRKAFFPAQLPFTLLHIDTGWKFREMIAFRDATVRHFKLNLTVHVNEEGRARGINPITSGSALHTAVMKTEALKQALDRYRFDAAFGGARRDEEKSRAKERIFSVRTPHHGWDPKNQRPELWRIYNTRLGEGESMRVFPLSNWTELDVWEYIAAEGIAVVPLYFAKPRPVVRRNGMWIMVDDDRLPLYPGDRTETRCVRFRTLGCYPLTGAIESTAATPADIVGELRGTRQSERQGRVIDTDEEAAMERKKREGYF